MTDERREPAREADLLERLAAARPEPPPDLQARIIAAVRAEAGTDEGRAGAERARPGALRAGRWALAAAAGLVLLLATLEMVGRRAATAADGGPLDRMALEDAPSPWVSEEDMGAGVPVLLDDLSDQELWSLLEELGG